MESFQFLSNGGTFPPAKIRKYEANDLLCAARRISKHAMILMVRNDLPAVPRSLSTHYISEVDVLCKTTKTRQKAEFCRRQH